MLGLVHLQPLNLVTLLASLCAILGGGLMLFFSWSVDGEGFEALTRMGIVALLVGGAGLWTARHTRRLDSRRKP